MKKYMDKVGKKALESKKKSDEVLENLLKEERKSKVKDNKENDFSVTNFANDAEVSTNVFAPPMKKDAKKEQEERELLEASLIMDDDDDFTIQQLEKAEKVEVKVVVKPAPEVAKAPEAVAKTLSANPNGLDSTIFNELQGIDFDAEIQNDGETKMNWNTVSDKRTRLTRQTNFNFFFLF